MKLYIVRHAIAVPHGTPGVEEEERPLTPEGVRKMRRNARALVRLKIRLDEIWTSPLLRARQTAEILAEILKVTKPIRESKDLRPDADHGVLASKLASVSPKKAVAVVGHEPNLGELATWLLTGSETSAIPFKKGAVACLEIDQWEPPAGNQLLWLLTPGQMARIDAKP